MTNVQQLVSNLEEIAALDKALWDGYRDSLLRHIPPIMNPFRAFPKLTRLRKACLLRWWEHYYVFLIGAFICGALALVVSNWLLFGYAALLIPAGKYRVKYVEAYIFLQIGRKNIARHSFGLKAPSLYVAGVMDSVKGERIKLDKATLESVIKLNKAVQELEDVAFGVADAIRKGVISVPYALAWWLFTTTTPVAKYVMQARDHLITHPALLGAMFMFLSGIAFITYQLAFSTTVTKRDKKRYMLVLNLVREAYQEHGK
jgi:hypothetical protein